jgi:hypothetical protein
MKRFAFAVLLVALVAPAVLAQENFRATLSGAAEVPPCDADGTGTALVTITGTTVTYTITVANIDLPPIAQHIHSGAAGVNGPIVVNLPGTWVGGTLSGTTTTTSAQAAAIIANPAGFYVNVHTNACPGGAVRGQLAATASTIPTASTMALVVLGAMLALGGLLMARRV